MSKALETGRKLRFVQGIPAAKLIGEPSKNPWSVVS
jgi:hypothetical protein